MAVLEKVTELFQIRLVPSLHARVKIAARFMGGTMTNFVRNAVIHELEIVEAKMDARAARQKNLRSRPKIEPTGLFRAEPPKQNSPFSSSDLDRFAAYILSADSKLEKTQREDEVVKEIAAGTSSREEAQSIVRALDKKITERLAQGES